MSEEIKLGEKRIRNEIVIKAHEKVRGLYIIQNFITEQEEEALLEYFDAQTWDTTLKRRVQHYGYRYDYSSKKIDLTMKAAPLPPCAIAIAERISTLRDEKGRLIINLNADNEKEEEEQPIDQLIVNEYTPGQGITAHTDCKPCFLDGISSLSLGSDSIMQFRRLRHENIDLPLLRRSLVILTSDARFNWTHAIPARKEDDGVIRKRRVSLTFRSVILSLN